MPWQRPSHKLFIKDRVRRRDGRRCVVCQIDQQTHDKRYGRNLDVHRIVPGSNYSTDWDEDVCVTLCEGCHDAIEGKGHWGWIKRDDKDNEKQLAGSVWRSTYQDFAEEERWRKHEAWGDWVKRLRLAKCKVLGAWVRRVNMLSEMIFHERILRDFESGRREPSLFEAKRLSTALGITLDELATEQEPDDGWRVLCEERSHRRALVFRAREPQEGEIEALCRGARLVWDVVGRADQKRAERREADRRKEENYRRAMLADQRPITFGE